MTEAKIFIDARNRLLDKGIVEAALGINGFKIHCLKSGKMSVTFPDGKEKMLDDIDFSAMRDNQSEELIELGQKVRSDLKLIFEFREKIDSLDPMKNISDNIKRITISDLWTYKEDLGAVAVFADIEYVEAQDSSGSKKPIYGYFTFQELQEISGIYLDNL
jgi:hypothetical protein